MSQLLQVIDKIKQVYDPEIPVNIYDVGLIYDVSVEGSEARVVMTLTSPSCPSAQEIPEWIHESIMELEFIETVNISIVWEPAWNPGMMSEHALMMLGIDDMY